MNKLERMLSADNKAVLSARAKTAMEDIAAESTAFIAQLEKEKRESIKRLNALTDIGPDESTSLRVVDESFDAAQWIKQIHALKMDIRLKEIEIKVAKEIDAEWMVDGNDEAND